MSFIIIIIIIIIIISSSSSSSRRHLHNYILKNLCKCLFLELILNEFVSLSGTYCIDRFNKIVDDDDVISSLGKHKVSKPFNFCKNL